MGAKPKSPNAVAIPTIGATGGPLPTEQAWLAEDIAERYVAAFGSCLERGWVLVLAAAGRTPQRAIELHGAPDGHQAGRAIDVSFIGMERQPGWNRDELDAILGSHVFHPLGASRKGDPNHYQTDDYGGVRQIGPQKFKDLRAACEWVANV